MKHDYSFRSGALCLRPLEKQDIEALRLLRNRPENRIWFFGSEPITKDGQLAWYERYLTRKDDYMFCVTLPEAPERFVGAVAVYDYDAQTDSFEVGRLLLDSSNLPRRGLGIELIRCLCELAGTVWGNVGLRAQIFSDNERSLRCFVQNDFEITGTAMEKGREVLLLSRRICK